ncbi:MAG: hypothetical protein PHY12_08285, partial [Eubacteriales bacterium]|nr:hypothetical protein [Eubacteriales bacterium]
MKRINRMLCLILLLALPARALALNGQTYDVFKQYYEENVTFINENDNRHLLPLQFSKQKTGVDTQQRIVYRLEGNVLSAVVTTDAISSVIESCVITLTAPANMEYGSAAYRDFAISGYHSYALLMAMQSTENAADRYLLVTQVVQGMADGSGDYTTQTGVYTLHAQRVEQS